MKHICFLFGVKINIYVYLLDRSWEFVKASGDSSVSPVVKLAV
jgi:hypothetical protein